MKKKITICCNNADEAAYIKKETERINIDSEKKIESFMPNIPNLNRLKSFLNNLADRRTTVTEFKVFFNEALNKLLAEGNFESDTIVVGRIKKEFASLKAKDHETVVKNTKGLIQKHELLFKEEEASKVYDLFRIDTVTNYDELKHKMVSDIDGLVVPCELTWCHEGSGYNANDYKGITLVQHLRSDKIGLTIPIIFTSDSSKKDIINKKKDAEIIRTPALQHRFINIMQVKDLWDSVLTTFKKMRKLNDSELKYTQLQYCDLEGMLKQIKHAIRSNPKNREHYKKQIEYILAKDFSNNESLLEEYRRSEDLEAF